MNSLLSKIGLGTVQFGLHYGISNSDGKTSGNEVSRILDYALTRNIGYLDTAYAYGKAEEVIGNNDLSNFKIVSKYISNNEFCLEEQINISLKRLNQKSIYGYLAHRPLDLIENNLENWNKLKELKENNKVTKIGASFNTILEIEKVLNAGVQPDIIQVPYNYLDSRFEKYMKILSKEGCEIHTRSTFLQGLFFCDIERLNPFFNSIKPILREIQSVEQLATVLLQHVLDKKFINVVNIGVNNLAQLEDNLRLIDQEEDRLPNKDYKIDSKILMPSEWPKN